MFRKFSLFAGKKVGLDLSAAQGKKRELELDIDKKIEEIKSNLKIKQQASAKQLASPTQTNSAISNINKRLSSKPAATCST